MSRTSGSAEGRRKGLLSGHLAGGLSCGGSGFEREGGCNAARRTFEWRHTGPGSGGAVVAGSGNAGQASPLGGS